MRKEYQATLIFHDGGLGEFFVNDACISTALGRLGQTCPAIEFVKNGKGFTVHVDVVKASAYSAESRRMT